MDKTTCNFNWDGFLALTKEIPDDLNKKAKLSPVDKETKKIVQSISHNKCYLCGIHGTYNISENKPYLQIHRIIPDGPTVKENLVYLCLNCRKVIHLILYITKKWRYTRIKKYVPI